jgi:hypothetical protein
MNLYLLNFFDYELRFLQCVEKLEISKILVRFIIFKICVFNQFWELPGTLGVHVTLCVVSILNHDLFRRSKFRGNYMCYVLILE